MKKRVYVLLVCIGLILFMSMGCASAPKKISYDRTSLIKKVAILTNAKDPNFVVLDHSGIMSKTYTGGQFGALGGLLEGIILSVEASHAKKKSLGGEPETLIAELDGYDVKKVIDQKLIKKLSKKFDIIELSHSNSSSKNNNFTELCTNIEADTLVKIEFLYGLATYADKKSSAAIDAEVTIFDVDSKKVLLKKKIKSDSLYSTSRTVNEFSENEAMLFKSDMSSAADSISTLIANDLGA